MFLQLRYIALHNCFFSSLPVFAQVEKYEDRKVISPLDSNPQPLDPESCTLPLDHDCLALIGVDNLYASSSKWRGPISLFKLGKRPVCVCKVDLSLYKSKKKHQRKQKETKEVNFQFYEMLIKSNFSRLSCSS